MPDQRTFGSILKANDGVGPGFDLLRLMLAVSIMASHCSSMSGTKGFLSGFLQSLVDLFWHHQPTISSAAEPSAIDPGHGGIYGLGRPFTLSHVPMFFALSGFLVMGSAFRTRKLWPFLALRFFRIFPALCVEVVLSAVVLGAVFTSLPLQEYYTSAGFYSYFLNILGIVHLFLPGVLFRDSPIVNANLWTLPAEFYSYLITAVLIVSGLLFRKRFFTICFAVATIGLLIANSFFSHQVTADVLPGSVNVYYFFVGALFFMWRDSIPYSWTAFAASVALTAVLMFSYRTVYIYPLMLTYITVFIGLTNIPSNALLRSGDYSYGIYLYGFPISQMLVASAPALQNNLFGLLSASVLVTGMFACFSWHFIEKRFLRLRKYFSSQSAKIAKDIHPSLG
jgi:peptidoglycan/LPS O-acetylase OafA/YrhL